MSYLVVQVTDELPDLPELIRAFTASGVMARADAVRQARYSTGVLAEGLDEEGARRLVAALDDEGIPCEAIAADTFPDLSPAHSTNRVDCRGDGLSVYDALGRPQRVPWEEVIVIGVGEIAATRFEITREGDGFSAGEFPMAYQRVELDEKRIEEPALAFVLRRGPTLYVIEAERMHFHGLGERLQRLRSANFRTVVGDLLRHAPHAARSRGAQALEQGARNLPPYPSRRLFENELRWLVWRALRLP